MSKLRKKILSTLIIIGNHSGCHQRPDRSFFYKGQQFPVCARCTGVAIGQLTAIIYNIFKKPVSLFYSYILLMSMGADWCIQKLEIKESTNKRRLITGIAGGFAVMNIYFIIVKNTFTMIKRFCSYLKNK